MEQTEQEQGGWSFRLAEPTDAEAFSRWVVLNPQIELKDIAAASKTKNPTVMYFAVEKDGIVIAFAPLYCTMTLAHLGFNPESNISDRREALQRLMDGVSAFAVQYGVREITTLSKEAYPIARWALKHGFDLEPRQLLKWDLNKVWDEAETPVEG